MLNKQVTDILPPKNKKGLVLDKEQKEIKSKKTKPNLTIKGKIFFIFSLVFLSLFGVFYFLNLSKAQIEIYPKTETFDLKTEITLDQSAVNLIQKEKILSGTFQSSGKILKEEKAEGIIRVYNEHSVSSQLLIATTRFVAVDGKVFRTPERVVIPGGTYSGGKFIPGEIDIKVIADEPGPEYNIGPTTFSIPGFAGTDRYLKFYAKSFSPMKGGFQAEVPVITEKDFSQAEEVLTEQAKNECLELFKKELSPEDFDFFSRNIQTEIIEEKSQVALGGEAVEFEFEIKAKCEVLFFEKEYVENYVNQLIIKEIPEEKNFVQENLKINFISEKTDLDLGEIALSLNISSELYLEIDIYGLKNSVAGKSMAEVKALLENHEDIVKANVKFWPFWKRKAPENLNNIDFVLKFD